MLVCLSKKYNPGEWFDAFHSGVTFEHKEMFLLQMERQKVQVERERIQLEQDRLRLEAQRPEFGQPAKPQMMIWFLFLLLELIYVLFQSLMKRIWTRFLFCLSVWQSVGTGPTPTEF